jgi:hypothetical protein
MKVFSQILLGIGLVLILIGGVLYLVNAVFTSQAELVPGSVVSITKSVDPDYNSELYCPVVKYTTKAGQTLTIDSDVCSSPADYAVGDQVQVYYNPGSPSQAQIRNFWSQNLEAVSMTGMGLPFAFLGLILWLGTRRRKQAMA